MLRTLTEEGGVPFKKIAAAPVKPSAQLTLHCPPSKQGHSWSGHCVAKSEQNQAHHYTMRLLLGHSTWAFLLIVILCTLSHVYLSASTEQGFASHRTLKLLKSIISLHSPRDSSCECGTKRWHNSIQPWQPCSSPQRGARLILPRRLPSIQSHWPTLRGNLQDSARPAYKSGTGPENHRNESVILKSHSSEIRKGRPVP